jgi:hypothetical protein
VECGRKFTMRHSFFCDWFAIEAAVAVGWSDREHL